MKAMGSFTKMQTACGPFEQFPWSALAGYAPPKSRTPALGHPIGRSDDAPQQLFKKFQRQHVTTQHQTGRLTEGPTQVAIADLGATRAFDLAGAFMLTPHQPSVRQKVPDLLEACDGLLHLGLGPLAKLG